MTDIEWCIKYLKGVNHIAEELDGKTTLVAFGFLDIYPKLEKNHPELKDCDDQTEIEIRRRSKKSPKNTTWNHDYAPKKNGLANMGWTSMAA